MAADLLELYDEAEEAGIDVAWFPLCEDRSMAKKRSFFHMVKIHSLLLQ